ncbi:MAG: flagellar export chaperone FliS [Phycisphaerae bacterium]
MNREPNPYLRDAILTASPEQLQLMLYDGAIRFTRQGIKALQDKNWEQCFNSFNRAQQIVLEMLNSLNYDVDRDLCKRMASIYNFIYRKLIEACSSRELQAANDALGLLEFQRETWLMLIERLKQERSGVNSSQAGDAQSAKPGEETAVPSYGTLCVEG